MQKIKYSFDHAGNITNIFNDVTPFGAFIGGYNNKYKYDGLHRLIWSDGDNMLGQYDMEMQYSPSGRIAHKQYTLPARALSHPVDMHYSYCDDYQPHAVRHIFDEENMTHCDLRLGQYTFNGKEKDYESGFHYYGARYYWSEVLTGWLSVDPMMDKYPNISPYNYCMWNPIKLVDPDGMDTTIVFDLDNASIYRREDTKRIGLYFVQVEHGEETTLYSGNTSYDRVNVGNNRTIISFKDAKQALDIYNYLKDNDVQFEWNLMFLKDGSADLVTSALLDKISMDQDDYSSENVESWRHYHPSFSGYLYWMPSERDQEFALSLGLCPSILDFCGQEYDFAPIIKENKNKVFTAEQYVRYKGILEKKNPTIRTYCK